jgi:hypothetical protein
VEFPALADSLFFSSSLSESLDAFNLSSQAIPLIDHDSDYCGDVLEAGRANRSVEVHVAMVAGSPEDLQFCLLVSGTSV